MKTLLIACLILIALPVFADENTTSSSMICDRFVISRGDTRSEVERKCGKPTDIETWDEERVKRDYYKNISAQTPEDLSQEPFLIKEYIKIEEWTYNFGPTRFIYYLRFENGRLQGITSGDYGY